MSQAKLVSIIVPLYNELGNIEKLFTSINHEFSSLKTAYELLFVNDGSTDGSEEAINSLEQKHPQVRAIHLSRNFGKEVALSAGLKEAKGDAALMIDADMQHPPRYIPEFITKWQDGADVVVGVRSVSGKDSALHDFVSSLYYKMLNTITEVSVVPNSTDFRLLDRQVIDQFNQFSEHSRMVRGLIDWLGYKRDYVMYEEDSRNAGKATYTTRKLIRLAVASFISMSLIPLKLSIWLGAGIVFLSAPLGFYMFIDKYYFRNYGHFSGPASLSVLILFLIGITLLNIGIVGVYIASIHSEVANRPLYAIRNRRH
jgi:polyisoprenyl-phosphate glycosyltransferase